MQVWVCAVYLIIIGCVTTSLVIMLLKGRPGIHNTLYAGCQLSVILWCASQVLLGVCESVRQQWAAYSVGNLGICAIGSLWLLFTISYNDKEGKLPGRWFFLCVVPMAFYLCFLTNPYHGLYYKSFVLGMVERGPVFYVNVAYSYLTVLVGSFLLLRRTSLSDAVSVFAAKIMIALAAIVPIILNVIQLAGLHHADFDLTAMGFAISTILVLLATIRFRFMDVNIKMFDSVIYHLSDGVMLFDEDEAVYSNPAFWEITGLKKRKLTYEQWERLVRERLTRVGDAQETADMDGAKVYVRRTDTADTAWADHGNGAEMSAPADHADAAPAADVSGAAGENGGKNRYLAVEKIRHDKKHVILVVKDVSQYYELLEAGRELAVSQQQYALSKERNRIAQQVHDTTGHTLVMVQSLLKLSMMEKEKSEEYLGQAQGLVKNGLRELREAINTMRRQEEAYLVTQAVSQLTSQVHEFEIEVTMQGEDSEKYAYLTTAVYDTLRESITNCMKYAQASRMEVVVRFLEDRLELLIADNGKGCGQISDNNGLRGIRERIAEKGGKVRFISSEGEGFMTKISLPVQ